ncbi:MAG: putative ABC transport system permease protein [Chlamydiales bacterium]|jgi:putative ABC transport system permease protein
MNGLRFVIRSLVHYRRSHLGVFLGSIVASAVLVGALLVGESVRASLLAQTTQRIGRVEQALVAGDRLVRIDLASELAVALASESARVHTAPVLQLPGIASADGGARRALDVQILGVDARFFELDLAQGSLPGPKAGEVYLNARLARQLQTKVGSSVLLRIEKPSAMPRDTALAANDDMTMAMRVKVARVLSADEFGRFSLQSHQVPPFNAMVSLDDLARRLEVADRCNLILAGDLSGSDEDGLAGAAGRERIRGALKGCWALADLQLAWREVDELGLIEIVSERVFLDDPLARACEAFDDGAVGVLTYFVNGLASGDLSTPYSMVASIGALGEPISSLGGWSDPVPEASESDPGIVAGRWLAEDLELEVGDELELSYFVLGAQATLVEEKTSFVVRAIVEPEGWAADPLLMPEFPGLAGSEHCRDWEPGTPVDLQRIRDKDEDYWEARQGTPKAFLTLDRGRDLWKNRFGSLTAVRVHPLQREALEAHLRSTLVLAEFGLTVQDVRTRAFQSGSTATDFGGLFIGLSFFLIVAALLLIALLFALAVELRSREVGALLAVGLAPRRIRRLFLMESALVIAAGTSVGAMCGVLYTSGVLYGLSTVWSAAVGAAVVKLHVSSVTLGIGCASSIAVSILALWLGTRRLFRRTAVELLAGGDSAQGAFERRPVVRTALIAILSALGAVVLVVVTDPDGGPAAAGAFFGAGSMALIAALCACSLLLGRVGSDLPWRASLTRLGRRNCGRRRSRSIATIAMLAAGTFLVLSVSVHRLGVAGDVTVRAGGTGGFSFFGTSSLPVLVDLNSERGRASFALEEEDWEGVAVVPLRVNAGDEASCLNLHLSTNPRLVGVRREDLSSRAAFRFARTIDGEQAQSDPWSLLDWKPGEPVPAIGDHAALTWALHKKVGDVIEYTDERGETFPVRIVGTLADSILQGSLVIPVAAFEASFPSQSGYRMFLVDAPPERSADVSQMLSRGLEDVGLQLTPTGTRLEEFHAVQNTYLVIFQMLGGLGLLLGSVGLGMVLLRNAFERRGEFAILRAVGFSRRRIRQLVLSEHSLLLGLGIVCGAVSSLVALIPSVTGADAAFPWRAIAGFLGLVLANGLAWNLAATHLATRGPLMDALRKE